MKSKKLLFLSALTCVVPIMSMANVMGQPTVRNVVYGGVQSSDGVYVKYQTPKGPFSGHFYLGLGFALNFANFDNRYHLDSDPSVTEKDSYSFKLMPGFDISGGYRFAQRWRGELNYGYVSKFEDKDNVASFSLSSQYLMANILYDIWTKDTTSIYIGAGAGASLLETRMSGIIFPPGEGDAKRKATYAGQFIMGIEEEVTPNISVMLQYRFMYTGGMDDARTAMNPDTLVFDDVLHTKTSGIMTNTIQLGARVRF
ncbi:MAG: porin family protein [Alphaproteobacteria bacterium]|nr:porin family protein [Alphaproteobacteria bacterium]